MSNPSSERRWRWKEQLASEWLDRAQMHEHLFSIGTAILIGVLCGLGAIAFRELIHLLGLAFWGEKEMSLGLLEAMPWPRRLLIPVVGGLLVAPIVYRWVREARGHGVPEVMTAVAVNKGIIRIRVAAAKALGSAITIASGGAAGREGPIIQIGSAIGSSIGQLLGVSARRMRTYVGCGAAAGIAATFNAPIAGALFSVEIILGEMGVSQFGPIVISSVVATVISRWHLGNTPVFHVPEYSMSGLAEMLPYAALGVLCAVVAVAFMKTLEFIEHVLGDNARIPDLLRPILGGLGLGVIGIWLPQVFADGYDTIDIALNTGAPWLLLLAWLVAKIVATSLTLGSGGSGGVFAPSLFLGAMAGGLVGQGVAALGGPAIQPGAYALVGMGGVVAATTRAPITAMIIIFEITSDYEIILPLMTVCILSTVVHTRLSKESIYTMKLAKRGIELHEGRLLDLLKPLSVSTCLRKEVETAYPDTGVRDLVERMMSSEQHQFYIVRPEGGYVGLVTLSDLRGILLHRDALEPMLIAEDLTNEGVPVCHPEENLSDAMLKFERSGLPELPVVDRASRGLLGELRYLDVVAMYNEQVTHEDAAEGVARRVTSATSRKTRLVGEFSMAEWEPPPRFRGKSLAEASFPGRFGVRVILVKQPTADAHGGERILPVMPDADYVIKDHDTLLVYGRESDLDRVLRL
jgi:CIC family chloride channel protein